MIERIDPGPRMSQAVVHGAVVYTAGHVDAQASDVAGQTRNILAKLDALLARSGSNRSCLLSANIWLADIATFDQMNAEWEAWIDKENPPARATVESKLAGPRFLVEIAVVAAVATDDPQAIA
ncbi:MAG: RidA family protein [Candidatus Baltobacteraceae bacterium]